MRSFKSFNPTGVKVGKIIETEESLAYWQHLAKGDFVRTKRPEADLKLHYKSTLEKSFAIALGMTILCFLTIRGFATDANFGSTENLVIQVEEIPVTRQSFKKPPPPRPAVPIASSDEDIPDDETIDDTEINFADIPAPPEEPLADDAEEIFVVYDIPPTPIGGFGEIYKHVVYPELAIKAGLEGVVFLKCLINTKGEVEQTQVLKPSGSDIGFEEAAQAAMMKVQWNPAKQRDRNVKVWVSVPVRFTLTDLKS